MDIETSQQVVTDRYLTQYRAVVEAARDNGIELEPPVPRVGDTVPTFIHERDAIVVRRDDQDDLVRMARWSGTSFATPIVAGAVAAWMTEHTQPNARLAAAGLLSQGTTQIVDVDGRTLKVFKPSPVPPI
jgi:hypothetical protein